MKKEFIASTALVGALTFGATVQAEEVVVGTETQAATTQEQVNLAQTTYESSQEQVANLENQIVNQETVVAQQEESVANAQTELTAAEELVKETAQAAEEATEENIVNAQTAIKEANQYVAEKTDALETVKAEANIAGKEEAVNTQEGVVAEKETDVAQKQEIFDADKEKLEKAEQAVKENATAISENEQYQSELTDSISEAEKSIQDAEGALERAKEAEASKKSQLEQAKTVLENAKTTLAEKESVLALAEKQLNEAKKATQSAQDAITALEDKYGIKQTITVTDKYVELLKKYSEGLDDSSYFADIDREVYVLVWENRLKSLGYDYPWLAPDEVSWINSPEYAEYQAKYEVALESYLNDNREYRKNIDNQIKKETIKIYEQNAYKSLEKDLDTLYDGKNLPKDVITELSLFASELMNQVREQFGTVKTIVTTSSVDFADKVTDKAVSDGWDPSTPGHYDYGITYVAKQFGLMNEGDKEANYFESWYSAMGNGTLDQMKKVVYDGILGFLTEGIISQWYIDNDWSSQGWGHAVVVAGIRNAMIGTDFSNEYVGLDFGVGTHLLTVQDTQFKQSTVFDVTSIDNPYETYATLLAEAQDVLADAQSKQDTEQKNYDKALGERNNAQTDVTDAEQKIKDIEAIETGLNDATIKLKTAQDNHTSLINKLEDAKKELTALQEKAEQLKETRDAYQEDVNNSQKALKDSQAILKSEQNKLDDLTDILKSAIKDVENAENTLKEAQEKLSSSEAYLTKLQTVLLELEDAQKLLEEVETIYNGEILKLQDEKDKLGQLQIDLASAIQNAKTNKDYYEYLLSLLEQEKLEEEKQAIIKSGSIPQAIVDETGKIVGYTAISGGAAAAAHATPTVTATSQASQNYSRVARAKAEKTLPSTGDAGSVLTLLGLGLTSLGLVGRKRRQD